MRVNIYAEEMTDKVELIEKTTKDGTFVGVRFWLELPVTVDGARTHRNVGKGEVFVPITGETAQIAGPFRHHPGDDDSAAVTFWGKAQLKIALRKALELLENHK